MKRTVMTALLLTAGVLARAEEKPQAATPPPAVATSPDESPGALEKKLLKKLADIEAKLDAMERDRKSDETARNRKLDQMDRDIAEIRRSVQRLESKR